MILKEWKYKRTTEGINVSQLFHFILFVWILKEIKSCVPLALKQCTHERKSNVTSDGGDLRTGCRMASKGGRNALKRVQNREAEVNLKWFSHETFAPKTTFYPSLSCSHAWLLIFQRKMKQIIWTITVETRDPVTQVFNVMLNCIKDFNCEVE